MLSRYRTTFSPLALSLALVLSACGGEGAAEPAEPAKDKQEAGAAAGAKDAASPEPAPEPSGPKKVTVDGFEWTLPVGLDAPPPVPADNPMSAAKVELGHKLFMDRRLSFDGSRSCYSCHQNQLGNADGRAKALGAGDKALGRNTPTIWNVGYHAALYWDGRASSLEKQALGAWKGGNMGVGADKLDAKAAEVGALDEYKAAFSEIFGVAEGGKVEPMHVAMALSAYERTLLCGDGERSDAATRGWDLFRGKALCTTCHNGPTLSDGRFRDVGLSHDATGALLEGADVGRGKPAKDEAEKYKFRTPTLRNVAQTGPYFHDGREASLEAAVRYMASGGNPKAASQDPGLRDAGLSDTEIADLVAYLQSLNCAGSLEVIGEQPVPGAAG
jgi:cytochrome c peroxidase